MKKTIELTLKQARKMLGKDEAMDALIRANFTEQELNPVKRWSAFVKKTQTEGVIAMAQLSQFMKDVNGDWMPDWKNGNNTKKYCIQCAAGKIIKNNWYELAQFLAFPTEEIRDKFAARPQRINP